MISSVFDVVSCAGGRDLMLYVTSVVRLAGQFLIDKHLGICGLVLF